MTFSIPRGRPRRVEGALRRLRLCATYKGEYYYRIQKAVFPECAGCEVPETVDQLFSSCLIHEREQAD